MRAVRYLLKRLALATSSTSSSQTWFPSLKQRWSRLKRRLEPSWRSTPAPSMLRIVRTRTKQGLRKVSSTQSQPSDWCHWRRSQRNRCSSSTRKSVKNSCLKASGSTGRTRSDQAINSWTVLSSIWSRKLTTTCSEAKLARTSLYSGPKTLRSSIKNSRRRLINYGKSLSPTSKMRTFPLTS